MCVWSTRLTKRDHVGLSSLGRVPGGVGGRARCARSERPSKRRWVQAVVGGGSDPRRGDGASRPSRSPERSSPVRCTDRSAVVCGQPVRLGRNRGLVGGTPERPPSPRATEIGDRNQQPAEMRRGQPTLVDLRPRRKAASAEKERLTGDSLMLGYARLRASVGGWEGVRRRQVGRRIGGSSRRATCFDSPVRTRVEKLPTADRC